MFLYGGNLGIIHIEGGIMEFLINGKKSEEIRRAYLEKINEIDGIIELEEIINVSQRLDFKDVLLLAYDKKAEILYKSGEYIKAFMTYSDVLELSYSLNRDVLPDTYNNMGKCKLQSLEYEEALPYFEKAYALSVGRKDVTSEKNSLYNIALNYKKLDLLDECLAIVEKYISLLDADSEFIDYIDGIILKANCYIEKKEFFSALQIYQTTLQLFSNNDDAIMGYIYNNLGSMSFETNRLDEAIEYYQKAKDIRTKNDLINLSHTLIDMAIVYFKLNDNEKGIELAKEGIHMASDFYDREYELKGYCLLEDFYKRNYSYESLKNIYTRLLDLLNDKQEMTKVYGKLALLYIENGEIELSKKYLRKIVEI